MENNGKTLKANVGRISPRHCKEAQEGTLSSETVFQSSTCIRALAYLLHIDYLLQYDFTNLRNI